MFELFLDAALLAVINSVNALVSTVDSISASISELFISSPVTVSHPPSPHPPEALEPEKEPEKMMSRTSPKFLNESVAAPVAVAPTRSHFVDEPKKYFVYDPKNWVPPYEQILRGNLTKSNCMFNIKISRQDFYPPKRYCVACRNTQPGCKNCQIRRRMEPSYDEITRLVENAKLNANVKIDNMFNSVKDFRDECKIFSKTVFDGLSYLHFVRMVQNSTLKDHRYLPLPFFNFSDFDGFFRKTAIFYPVSLYMKDFGMKFKISDEDLILFVQFPNSQERIYPEFENVSTRNELLALSMSMRILYCLVSSNDKKQSWRNQFLSRTLISKRIFSRIIARKLVLAAPKK
jgi:hypothetical protein